MDIPKLKITIIGFGNVGFHLTKALLNNGFKIHQIFNRNLNKANEFASTNQINLINNVKDLDYSADIYIFCLKDDVIEELLTELNFTDQLLLHTAGSINQNIFEDFSTNYGVLYPVQTFNRNIELNFDEIPLCIESNNLETLHNIKKIAESISNNVQQISSEERKNIHIAAVFANNYVNAMYAIAQEILEQKDIDFNVLRPLILETAKKVQSNTPIEVQTGPAIRKDSSTITNHIESLSDKHLKYLYETIAKYIQERHL